MNSIEKTWLFITRAQPGLHYGHLDGIKQAIEQGITKVIIGVGSSNKEFTAENPFTYKEREQMIELSVKSLLNTLQVEIVPVPDVGNNQLRREYLLRELPPFQYVVSWNARVQGIFEGTEKEIIPLTVREMVKGSTIREWLARNNKEWLEQVLAPEVLSFLESIHACERVKEIFQQERKVPGLVTDTVMFDEEGKLILIERKNYPKGPALAGGFLDIGERVEESNKREVLEETTLEVDDLVPLGIRDHPDRDPRGHNISIAYRAKTVKGTPKAKDDAKAIIKIDPDLDKINALDFAFPDHKEMILKALEMRAS